MAGITSTTGLISGINTASLIDQLIALETRPVNVLKSRIATNNQIKLAYSDLTAQLTSLNLSLGQLIKPSTFAGSSVSSSDATVASATVAAGAAAGSYSFRVARLVTTQSSISQAFSSGNATLNAGSITIGQGGGELASAVDLSTLNAGKGIRTGSFRVTDKSGGTSVVDITGATTLDDVIKKINTAQGVNVKATIDDNGLHITDASGGAGSLKIEDVGGGTSASELGIAKSAATGDLVGSDINTVGRNTKLSALNDGLGIRTAGGGQTDFNVQTSDGNTISVSLGSVGTLGDVVDALNKAGNIGGTQKFTASIGARGLQLTDVSGGGGTFGVKAQNESLAAADLGLTASASGNTITGSDTIAKLGTVLVKTLNGGQGLSLGNLSVTDRAGNTAQIDLSGATNVKDVLAAINGASGASVGARINDAGTGIAIFDKSSGSGNLIVANGDGTNTANALGLTGTVASGGTIAQGKTLNREYVSTNSLLSTLNGGNGIGKSTIQVTNKNGLATKIDLSASTISTLGDVIKKINNSNAGVTASLNETGNGLLLTDTSGGAGSLSVTDLTGGTAAKDLRIAGSTTGTGKTLDGAYSATVTVKQGDTLSSVQSAISSLGFGVNANLVNDGTGVRLSLNSAASGRAGRYTIDSGTTGLSLTGVVAAQDALVYLGSDPSSQVAISSTSNTISGIVPGVNLTLQSVSNSPVNITVTRSSDTAVSQIQSFVSSFNALSSKISKYTKFDTTTNNGGVLLGDSSTTTLQSGLFSALSQRIATGGKYTQFSQVGLTVGKDNQISFDATQFQAAYIADPTSVQKLFTALRTDQTVTTTDGAGNQLSSQTSTLDSSTGVGTTSTTDSNGIKTTTSIKQTGFGLAYLLQNAVNKLIDPVNGSLTESSQTVDDNNNVFQSRITTLNDRLTAKRAQLQKQFADLETSLAKLQGQQTALNSFTNLSYTTK